jgi:hypothetical protein
LVLRGHSIAHRHAGVLPTSLLLLLQALIIGHLLLLLVRHVTWVHARRTGNIRLLRVDVGVVNILGRLCWHLRSFNAIFVGGGIGSIEASLEWNRSTMLVSD